jgi:hypothetical protein
MAWVVPFLSGIGTGLTGGTLAAGSGTAASIGAGIGAAAVPVATIGGTLASAVTGGIAASKKPPKPPMTLDERRALLAQRLASGRTSRGEMGLAATTLTGARGDLTAAPVGKRTLLGG